MTSSEKRWHRQNGRDWRAVQAALLRELTGDRPVENYLEEIEADQRAQVPVERPVEAPVVQRPVGLRRRMNPGLLNVIALAVLVSGPGREE